MEPDDTHVTDDVTRYVLIPWRDLSSAALTGLIESFLSREGTDYGEHEISMSARKEQALRAIQHGSVSIVFDSESESINLVETAELAALGLS